MEYNIEGFEQMTAEEKLAALQSFVSEYDPEKNGFVKKSVLDAATSDASKYKKDLKNAQTSQKTLEERVAQLEKEKEVSEKISTATANFLSLGYDGELAKSSAEALVNGDHEKLMENQKTFLESYKQTVTVNQLVNTPKPAAGSGAAVPVDYSKLKEEAFSRGDNAAYAYYTRLEQQQGK